MASRAMWEVDPETRSKLAALQKEFNNNICCDCNAPSPQWASPKFGIFICLTCAGVHRGLGVHISFVRSISMDAFKSGEIERMRLGGNAGWKKFFEEHEDTQMMGIGWDDATIADRYSGHVGEEWKERLTCLVEGKEFVSGERQQQQPATSAPATSGSKPTATPALGAIKQISRTGTPLSGTSSRGGSPKPSSGAGAGSGTGKVKVDDKYFAKLGADNASRPDDVPPNQGGKYGGFGNMPAEKSQTSSGDIDFAALQKDAVASITKGFGWFTKTVSSTAKNVNEGYLQPTATKFAEGDFAKQAQMTAATFARQAQAAGKSASDNFTRFVEGNDSPKSPPMDESRKDFWDSFSKLGQSTHQRTASSSAIGTSAMGMGKKAQPSKQNNQEEWDDW